MRTLAALTTLTTLALAGAAGAQSPSLTNTTWTLTLVQQDGRTLTPVGPQAPTLRLDGRTASGSTSCNTYRAAYASRADVLRFGPLATTRRACPGAVGTGETRFLNLMRQVTGYQLSGQTLTLFVGPRDRLLFRAGGTATTPEAALTLNGTWQLVGGTALQPVAGSLPNLTFAGNRVGGSAGCNRLTGSVGVQGGQLTFGPLATTRMACAPAVNAQEAAFLRFLAEPSLRGTLQGQTLTLTAANGRTLIFRRAAPSGEGGTLNPATLVGQTYTLTAVGGRAVAPGTAPVTLTFERTRLGGSDGCNQYAAPYRWVGSTLVLTAEPISTLRACPDQPAPVNLPALLASRPTVAVTAAGLTLRVGETTLTFSRN